MRETESAWLWLILGCMITGGSLYGLTMTENGLGWRGVPVPLWAHWLLLICGIALLALSIRALLQGKGKHEPFTDEDAARAEAELDAMYLREHGELPDKSKKDT